MKYPAVQWFTLPCRGICRTGFYHDPEYVVFENQQKTRSLIWVVCEESNYKFCSWGVPSKCLANTQQALCVSGFPSCIENRTTNKEVLFEYFIKLLCFFLFKIMTSTRVFESSFSGPPILINRIPVGRLLSMVKVRYYWEWEDQPKSKDFDSKNNV